MKYRKLGSSDLEVSESSMNGSMDLVMSEARLAAVDRLRPIAEEAGLSLAELTPDTVSAIDQALGDAPVKVPAPAPFARPGVKHR